MTQNGRNSKSIQLNCFSPPIMLATFVIETVLAIYTVWRYKMTVLTRLITAGLLALGVFQLCEYHVCGGMGIRAAEWSRLGYVAISMLPPLGLHMLHVMANKPKRKLVSFGYISMVAFIGFFLFIPSAFQGYQCTGNYVIFQIGLNAARLYGLYYYGLLLAAIGLGMRWANQLKAAGKKSAKRLASVRGLIIGYLVFLVPTALANSVKPETRRGIPSIMCGFAVLFAIILTLYVLPRLGEKRQRHLTTD
jgi:hypothetical protein